MASACVGIRSRILFTGDILSCDSHQGSLVHTRHFLQPLPKGITFFFVFFSHMVLNHALQVGVDGDLWGLPLLEGCRDA